MRNATSEQVIIRSGRRMPQWTDVPDWVTWAYTPRARELYRLLKMHVNARRDDTQVWPLQRDLAEMMHLSRGDKLAPYLRELSADLPGCAPGSGGAIGIDKTATVPSQAVYTVHDTPPSGYTGCMSLAQWYAERRSRRDGPPPARSKPQVTPDAPSGGDVQPPANVTDSEPPCTPSGGYLDTPCRGYLDTPCTGHQLKEGNPPKGTTPPTVPAPATPPRPAGDGRPVGDDPDRTRAGLVLARVLDGVSAGALPTRTQSEQLSAVVVQALSVGWQVEDLVCRLSGLGGVRNVYGALRYRLEQLPPLQARTVADGGVDDVVPQWRRERQERVGGLSQAGVSVRDEARRRAQQAAVSAARNRGVRR